MIVSGEVKPQDRLPTEAALCEHFGVSRITIREAVQMLRALGLVESTRGRGTFVRQPDPDARLRDLAYFAFESSGPIEDVFEVRTLLESRAALRAARAARVEREDLMGIIVNMRAVLDSENPDVSVLEEMDMEFHLRIATLSGNLALEQLMRRLMQILAVVRSRSLAVPGQRERSWGQHKLIAEAIVIGDPDLAVARVVEHMEAVKAAVLRATPIADNRSY